MSYFKAYLGAANELPSTLERIPRTLPAISVTTLDIKFKNFFALWLYYFNYKYPNLQFLRLDISIGYHNWWPAVLTQDVTYTYPLNPNRLQHLETLELITEEISMRTHLVFWQFIYPLKAPIKNLKYIATSSHSTAQHYAANVKSFLQSFSETLETLSVEGKLFFYIKQCPELELSSYSPFLKDLHIKSCGFSIDLALREKKWGFRWGFSWRFSLGLSWRFSRIAVESLVPF
ncbi:hypothetical protein PHYBLDRAFT_73420 [Phycomyces blakesleeanus NRRL 1555(-)]|uniref:Uncharacterized protein n=2 Tax=Phycomyces blakesleeanus TaxID=4837 RepID=A0A162VC00_PHYB8|nr:hypothetical protein PHYBLDRAFT_73420 [Phycomyces blakesleeanus NRRL 1555(-)]OAD81532.1 hypothetical protein PHYBLDRAFT_73420 [Phycomyces blakesleeanus NRRL 1555(-)]|eukprot:XP_018299572.1 hypothetical protein PHYBLDRAFT_73420 [Phycomyces blakesleeanus NRRL 1555(-)]